MITQIHTQTVLLHHLPHHASGVGRPTDQISTREVQGQTGDSSRVLIEMRYVAVFGETENTQAVVPVCARDQQLRVVGEHENTVVYLQVGIEWTSY